jgi:AcrR family transcriptional regulator
MTDTDRTGARKSEGLRERKRRQTRERIADAAKTLFLERGFETTTVDEIAAAADVSKRSFFDYFPAKEDVISAWQDEFGLALAAAVLARPAGEPLTRVVEAALTSAITAATADPQMMAMGRLIHDTPALGARNQMKYTRLEQRLGDALIERAGSASDDLRLRLLAMIVVGALRVGTDRWHREEHPTMAGLEAHAETLFKMLWAELAAFGGLAEGEAPVRSG